MNRILRRGLQRCLFEGTVLGRWFQLYRRFYIVSIISMTIVRSLGLRCRPATTLRVLVAAMTREFSYDEIHEWPLRSASPAFLRLLLRHEPSSVGITIGGTSRDAEHRKCRNLSGESDLKTIQSITTALVSSTSLFCDPNPHIHVVGGRRPVLCFDHHDKQESVTTINRYFL
jgi:hypothetical protein